MQDGYGKCLTQIGYNRKLRKKKKKLTDDTSQTINSNAIGSLTGMWIPKAAPSLLETPLKPNGLNHPSEIIRTIAKAPSHTFPQMNNSTALRTTSVLTAVILDTTKASALTHLTQTE